MRSPFLYFAGDRLSPAELSAARLDGDLVEIDEAYLPADAVETRELRAGSLQHLLGDTLAATHVTAAWVHGALSEPPSRHTVQRAVARRLHHVIGRRLRYRDLRVDPDDLVRIGGVWVTTPARTVADLARIRDAEYAHALERMVDAASPVAHEAIVLLEARAGLPHKRAALRRLRELEAEAEEGAVRTT
jgi:hypothetical protein